MNFNELGLPQPILDAITKMGFETPTPVQEQVIPRLLQNEGDLVALAQTGTGKTAAFGLPILSMLDHTKRTPQALVLCPTRELCVQITRDMQAYAACSPAVSMVAVYGGTPIVTQLRALERGVQVIVATPGRMLDILRRGRADLSGVQRVILDEADEMLNMGFQEDLEAILGKVPDSAHTLLFSATMPRHVATIAKKYMTNAEEITVGQLNAGADTVTHELYIVHQRDRYRALKRMADYYPDMYAIIFCRTRKDTQEVAEWLIRDGYNVDALHGELTQAQRDRVMDKFRAKSIQLLVATDVAARGLDVTELTHVINYNLPDELSSYTHRSGRTGRAGKEGVSVLIINMREKGMARRIDQIIGKSFNYRDVPSGKEICEAQLFSLVKRMKSVEVNHAQIDQYLPSIYAELEGMEVKDVVARFVSLEFSTLLDYYRGEQDLSPGERKTRSHERDSHGRDGDSRGRDGDSHGRGGRPASNIQRLFINLGNMDGLNASKLMGLISSEGGHNVPIGRVDIMRKYSFFDVASQDVDTLREALSSAQYNGRPIRIDPVDDDTRGKRVNRTERRVEARGEAGAHSRGPRRDHASHGYAGHGHGPATHPHRSHGPKSYGSDSGSGAPSSGPSERPPYRRDNEQRSAARPSFKRAERRSDDSRGPSRGAAERGSSQGVAARTPSRGPSDRAPYRGPSDRSPSERAPYRGPSRGPAERGPSRGPAERGPSAAPQGGSERGPSEATPARKHPGPRPTTWMPGQPGKPAKKAKGKPGAHKPLNKRKPKY